MSSAAAALRFSCSHSYKYKSDTLHFTTGHCATLHYSCSPNSKNNHHNHNNIIIIIIINNTTTTTSNSSNYNYNYKRNYKLHYTLCAALQEKQPRIHYTGATATVTTTLQGCYTSCIARKLQLRLTTRQPQQP